MRPRAKGVKMKFRTELSAPGLWSSINQYFGEQVDPRGTNGNIEVSFASVMMSASALFALKFQSLLEMDNILENGAIAHNLKSLFHVVKAPSDTQMREIVDRVDPKIVNGAHDLVFLKAQRGKVLENYSFLDNGYLLALDATGYFDSKEIQCGSCCIKKEKDGTITYYHQFLPAVIVHPKMKQVIPLGAEPISVQDGVSKNDCEQNAAARLLRRIRQSHPKLKLTIVEDSLFSKGPHIELLRLLGFDFIIGAKESDHKFLFQQIRISDEAQEVTHFQLEDKDVIHQFRFKNDVFLNGTSKEKVNFFEYWETSKKTGKVTHWSWVTSIMITTKNIMDLMRGGRARWRIENETFNTLKNKGYQFEHNFGHGYRHLSTNFASLMLLAFGIDQLQELCCTVFQKAKEVWNTRTKLWSKMRAYFEIFMFKTWQDFFDCLIAKKTIIYDP